MSGGTSEDMSRVDLDLSLNEMIYWSLLCFVHFSIYMIYEFESSYNNFFCVGYQLEQTTLGHSLDPLGNF